MATSYLSNPYTSQTQWDRIMSASTNNRGTAVVGQGGMAEPTTYMANPYVSRNQFNSVVVPPSSSRAPSTQQAPSATQLPQPPSGGVDMSLYRPNQASPIQAAPGTPYQSYFYSPPANSDRTARRLYADRYLENIEGIDPGQFTDEQINGVNQAYRDSMISHTPTYSRDQNGNVVRTNYGQTGVSQQTFAPSVQQQAPQQDWMNAFFPGYGQPAASGDTPQVGLAVGSGPTPYDLHRSIATELNQNGNEMAVDAWNNSSASGSTSASSPALTDLPAGTEIIRGPQGGYVFPGEAPPGYVQQSNGGYAPALTQPSLPQFAYQGASGMPQQSMFSPSSFLAPSAASFPQMPVIRQPSFTVTQDPSVFGQAPELPQAGFFPQYTDLQGNVSSEPNYGQRDAFVDLINQNLLPYQTGQMSGPPQYDIASLLGQANSMAQGGYSNPFSSYFGGNAYSAMSNPLAGLFG